MRCAVTDSDRLFASGDGSGRTDGFLWEERALREGKGILAFGWTKLDMKVVKKVEREIS
jgi:hypothetical protein